MRSKRSSKEQVNYLASVSDLMSALLFVFILTLAVAIIQARSAARTAQEEAQQARQATIELLVTQKKLGTVERRLRETANALQSLLASLETRLRSRNIDGYGSRNFENPRVGRYLQGRLCSPRFDQSEKGRRAR